MVVIIPLWCPIWYRRKLELQILSMWCWRGGLISKFCACGLDLTFTSFRMIHTCIKLTSNHDSCCAELCSYLSLMMNRQNACIFLVAVDATRTMAANQHFDTIKAFHKDITFWIVDCCWTRIVVSDNAFDTIIWINVSSPRIYYTTHTTLKKR